MEFDPYVGGLLLQLIVWVLGSESCLVNYKNS